MNLGPEFLVVWVVMAIIGAMIGSSKGMGSAGFFLGLLLGPIGWIIVAVLQPSTATADRVAVGEGRRPCPHCAEFIRPEANVCRFCGRDVEPVPAVTRPPVRPPATPAEQRRAWLNLALMLAAVGIMAAGALALTR